MADTVLIERRGSTWTLTLNRPEKLNCINWEMMKELSRALTEAEEDPDLRLLVLRGAGERSFSTGGDLKEFRNLDSPGAVRWIRLGQQLFDGLAALPVVTLAVIDGFAFGGGLELALACDFRLATPAASFSAPELQLGWPPGWGALSRLTRVVGESKAREMIFLGERIDGRSALESGLVNWLCEENDVEGLLKSVEEKAAKLDPSLIAFSRSALASRSDSSSGTQVDFDVIATLYSKSKSQSD